MTYDGSYVTVSLDNGAFDLLDGISVEPRLSRVFGAARYSLDQVSECVRR